MAHTNSSRLRIDSSPMDSSNVEEGFRTAMETRQPEHIVRTLKMPLLRTDVDDARQGSSQIKEGNSTRPAKKNSSEALKTSKRAAKRGHRPATVVEQLKHCLGQYELLQKQLLCAELTGTSVADQHKFEQAAKKLIGRITSLRQQLSEKSTSNQRIVPQKRTATKPPAVVASSTAVNQSESKGPAEPATVLRKRTVKLSVSLSTAMVLKAFADAGKRPSTLVERALWADRDVQDAALLLKLKSPAK